MKKLLISAVVCLSMHLQGAYYQGQQPGPVTSAALKKYNFYNKTADDNPSVGRPLVLQRRKAGESSYFVANTLGLYSSLHQGMWPQATFVDISILSEPGHSQCRNDPTSPGCAGYIGTVFMPASDSYDVGKNCSIKMKTDDTQMNSQDAFTPEGSAYYIECVQR